MKADGIEIIENNQSKAKKGSVSAIEAKISVMAAAKGAGISWRRAGE